jgi:hypothetical protein
MQNYINIPATGFTSTNVQTKSEYIRVANKVSATLILSHFSIMQLIQGARLYSSTKEQVPGKEVSMMCKLFDAMLQGGESISIDTTRSEVKTMKMFLETRMSHCEAERDNRTTKTLPNGKSIEVFNTDTYIGQKILLIELREWLLGEEVSEERLYDLPAKRKSNPSLKDQSLEIDEDIF